MISTETCKVKYSGNDSTTIFPYTYKINDAKHLVVLIADADDKQTLLVLDTDYSVSDVGEEDGGNVTYPIAGDPLPTGSTIAIYRDAPYKQLSDFIMQGPWSPATIEGALDYAVMLVQQLEEKISRAFLVSVTGDGEVAAVNIVLLWDGTKLYLDKTNYPDTYLYLDDGDFVFVKAGVEDTRI